MWVDRALQVIVVSQDLGLLSSTVLALTALTRPLLWVHPLVPVMPVDMGEVLSAPVPYLIGEAPEFERFILVMWHRKPSVETVNDKRSR